MRNLLNQRTNPDRYEHGRKCHPTDGHWQKNWLFFGTECSGQTAAVLYTLVESCRRHQIDPESYFRHVLSVLPMATTSQIKDLTPRAIARRGLLPRIGKPSRRWNVPQSRAA